MGGIVPFCPPVIKMHSSSQAQEDWDIMKGRGAWVRALTQIISGGRPHWPLAGKQRNKECLSFIQLFPSL